MRYAKLSICWLLSGGLLLGVTEGNLAADAKYQTKAIQSEKKSHQDPLFPFTISKETTRITEPRRPDGTVDYATALNARLSAGLAPENNAGLLLMKAIGTDGLPEATQKGFIKSLGMASQKDGKGSMKVYGDFVEDQISQQPKTPDTDQSRELLWDQQYEAMNRPWSRKDYPIIADWLDANAEALESVVATSQNSRLYLPIVVEEKGALVEAVLPPGVVEIWETARLLCVKAMSALNAGACSSPNEYRGVPVQHTPRSHASCFRTCRVSTGRGALSEKP